MRDAAYKYLEQQPRIGAGHVDSCGRALLPFDDAFIVVGTRYGAFYGFVVVKKCLDNQKIVIRLNPATRFVFILEGLPPAQEFLEVDANKVTRLPGSPPLRRFLLAVAHQTNLAQNTPVCAFDKTLLLEDPEYHWAIDERLRGMGN